MKLTRLLLIAAMAFVTIGTGIASSSFVQAYPLLSQSSSPNAAGSPIVSDQFTIAGTRGTGFCDMINSNQITADQRGVNAGRIHLSFNANASVDFWMLNPIRCLAAQLHYLQL
jgi:hypothetical protein